MTALLGKRIVVTGAAGSESALIDTLTNHGAEILSYPCIEINPVADPTELDAALARAANGAYTWIAFTSTKAVEQVLTRLHAIGPPFPKVQLAAIGPITAKNLPSPERGRGAGGEGVAENNRHASAILPLSMPHTISTETTSGIESGPGGEVVQETWTGGQVVLANEGAPIFIPSTFTAAALAAELPITPGDTVLIPQANIALPTLADGLRARGADVTTVTAYRTTTGTGGIDLPAHMIQRRIDAVLFASPSAITGCQERFVMEGAELTLLNLTRVICIGPVTAAAALDLGLTNLVIAPEHTRSGMANTLLAEFAAHREETLA